MSFSSLSSTNHSISLFANTQSCFALTEMVPSQSSFNYRKYDFEYIDKSNPNLLSKYNQFLKIHGINKECRYQEALRIFYLLDNNGFVKKDPDKEKNTSIHITFPNVLPDKLHPTFLQKTSNFISKLTSFNTRQFTNKEEALDEIDYVYTEYQLQKLFFSEFEKHLTESASQSTPKSKELISPHLQNKQPITSHIRQSLDVSHHQCTGTKENIPPDWKQIFQAGYIYPFIKATQGNTYIDPCFKNNLQAIYSVVPTFYQVGTYHFLVPDSNCTIQATHYLNTLAEMEKLGYYTSHALDVEASTPSGTPWASKKELTSCVLQFADELGKHAYFFIYTGPYFWNSFFDTTQCNDLLKHGASALWVAEYNVSQPKPVSCWKTWCRWQTTDSGAVKGVSQLVDLDEDNTLDPNCWSSSSIIRKSTVGFFRPARRLNTPENKKTQPQIEHTIPQRLANISAIVKF